MKYNVLWSYLEWKGVNKAELARGMLVQWTTFYASIRSNHNPAAFREIIRRVDPSMDLEQAAETEWDEDEQDFFDRPLGDEDEQDFIDRTFAGMTATQIMDVAFKAALKKEYETRRRYRTRQPCAKQKKSFKEYMPRENTLDADKLMCVATERAANIYLAWSEGKSLQEVGDEFGISRQRVQQIINGIEFHAAQKWGTR